MSSHDCQVVFLCQFTQYDELIHQIICTYGSERLAYAAAPLPLVQISYRLAAVAAVQLQCQQIIFTGSLWVLRLGIGSRI